MAVEGDRVELIWMNDPYAPVEPGTRGTVGLVDAIGTVHVDWDNGRSLGMVPGEDRWRVIRPADEKEEE